MGNYFINNSIKLNVNLKGTYLFDINDTFVIDLIYLKEEELKNIFNKIIKKLNKKYYPVTFGIHAIDDESFTGYIWHNCIDKIENKSITEYDIDDITQKGLNIVVFPSYNHQIKYKSIDCEYMNKVNSKDALHCPIYHAMKEHYEWNQDNLNHLNEYRHFEDEYNDKPKCTYMDGCKAYIRMENGGNNINDECHMKLYRHPPRTRNITLQQNVNAFIINKKERENKTVYKPTENDDKKYKWNENYCYLHALIEEVITNGFKNDLCLFCGSDDECKHNDGSILTIVDDKMDHYRHKAVNKPLDRGEMLSLILYTGCDCNYDLCKAQRNGDYNKWKWFDYCLFHAIAKLSSAERGSFTVYSGLNNVKMSTKSLKCGYFCTYVSTSWNKNVAMTFMNGDGMVISIDKEFKNGSDINCCDVSWISKFPDECEVLFARSTKFDGYFKCTILDDSNPIQSVSLKLGYSVNY